MVAIIILTIIFELITLVPLVQLTRAFGLASAWGVISGALVIFIAEQTTTLYWIKYIEPSQMLFINTRISLLICYAILAVATPFLAQYVLGQQKREASIQSEIKRFKLYIDLANTFFVVIGNDQRVKLINKKGACLLGLKEHQIIGKNWFDNFIPKHQREELKQSFEKIMSGKVKPLEYLENFVVAHDGSERLIAWHTAPLKDEHGNLLGPLCAGEDITDKKRLENELRKSTSEKELLFSAIPDLIFRISSDGTIMEYSAGKEEDLYVPPKIFLNKKMQDVLPPEVGRQLTGAIKQAFQTNTTITIEYTLPIKEKIKYFEARLVPYNLSEMAVFIRNVSAQKILENQLKYSEETFKQLAEQSPNMIFLNNNGHIVYTNTLTEKLLGYSREELFAPKFNFLKLIAPEYHESIKMNWKNHEAGREIAPYEYELLSKDGKRIHAIISTKLLSLKDGPLLLGVVTDISNYVLIENQLKDALNTANKTNRILKLLSLSNQTLIRAKDEIELINTVCKNIQEIGGYKMVWVGESVDDKEKTIKPIIHCGFEDGYLDNAKFSWSEKHKYGLGPTGQAIRSHKTIIFNDLEHEPLYAPWYTEAQKRGYKASIALPLIKEPLLIGIINIYSDKTNAFSKDEVELLTELANDLAFGIASIRDQHKLQSIEAQYSTIINKGSEAIILIQEGKFVFVNPKLLELLGYSKEEVIDHSFIDYIADADKQLTMERYTRRMRGEDVITRYEVGVISKSKKIIPVELNSSTIEFDGKASVIVIIRDISQQKAAEKALKESEEKYRSIVEISPDAIAIISEGKVLFVNNSAVKLFGFTKSADMIGKSVSAAIPINNIKIIKEGKPTETKQDRYLKADGTPIDVEVSAMPMKFDNVPAIQVLIHDISELKRIERMKEDFISMVSHELKTPVTILKESISQILDGLHGEIPECQRKILNSSTSNIDRLGRLIHNLLDASRIEAGKLVLKLEPVDITEIVNNAIAILQDKVSAKHLKINKSIDIKDSTINADKEKIVEIFCNLLENSLKFTNQGQIDIFIKDDGDFVECKVMDTGIGIAKGNLPRMFDKFEQFNRTAGPGEKGTGLGLAIVKSFVELHGGQIHAESEEGKGTTITFTLNKNLKREKIS